MAFLLGFLVGPTVSTPAISSSITGGKVTAVYASGNKGLVDVSGSHAPPACAGSMNWAFDLTTSAGQAAYATALTAYATKANVIIVGSGTCDQWSDRETISMMGLTP